MASGSGVAQRTIVQRDARQSGLSFHLVLLISQHAVESYHGPVIYRISVHIGHYSTLFGLFQQVNAKRHKPLCRVPMAGKAGLQCYYSLFPRCSSQDRAATFVLNSGKDTQSWGSKLFLHIERRLRSRQWQPMHTCIILTGPEEEYMRKKRQERGIQCSILRYDHPVKARYDRTCDRLRSLSSVSDHVQSHILVDCSSSDGINQCDCRTQKPATEHIGYVVLVVCEASDTHRP